MALQIKNERARLLRRMEQALRRLSEQDPETVAEYRAARAGLEALDVPDAELYLRYRSTKEAITACLEHEEKWLSKREIAHKLFNGGFSMHPELGMNLVVANITKNIQRGHFVLNQDGNVGLPEWQTENT